MKHLVVLIAPLFVLAFAPTEAPADHGFCPPGLAKKDPPCIPPGQARRFGGHGNHDDDDDRDDDDDDHDDDRWDDDDDRADGRWDDDDDDDHFDRILVEDIDRFGNDDGRVIITRRSDQDDAAGSLDSEERVLVLGRGDVLRDGQYERIRDTSEYRLPGEHPAWEYYRVGDQIVAADPQTRRIITLIGAVESLRN